MISLEQEVTQIYESLIDFPTVNPLRSKTIVS